MCGNGPWDSLLEREVTLTEKKELAKNLFVLSFESQDPFPRIQPGQFVMLRTSLGMDPLLGRPFAVCGTGESRLELLVAVAGRGTRLLCSLPERERLFLRGPLGKGFPPQPGKRVYCLAGTTGIAPFLLARQQTPKIHVHLGIPGRGWGGLATWAAERIPGLCVYSEDSSVGIGGTPLACIDQLEPLNDVVWACGPTGMLKAVQTACERRKIPCWISLETRMACGIGGCHGCVVRTVAGLRKTCTDGPVFDSREVLWND